MIKSIKQFIKTIFWISFVLFLFAYAAHGPEMFGWGYLQ